MHEGGLTEDLFDHVLIHAREANARRVTRVKVTIGALSDFTAESIQFYWDSLAPGTIAEGAALEFITAPGTAKCPACGAEFEISEAYTACPKCGTFPVAVTGGEGVYLASLEVETGDDQHEHIHE
jgi:hydrogenase nickel incorporation protein HypA/HybF